METQIEWDEVTAEQEPASDLATALDDTVAFVRRFAVLPGEHDYFAFVLWCAHTWAHQASNVSPRLAVLGDSGCGKTRVLDLAVLLCANARLELDPTGPALAAMISQRHPTLLLDETDTIFGAKGSSTAKQQLRGILNSGYKKGAKLSRRNKNDWVEDEVFCPVGFAGIGILPETLMNRSAPVLRMRKRRPGETIEPYYPRMHEPLGKSLGEALGKAVECKALDLATAWPSLPEGVEDRPAELWATLLAVADVAGGHWPQTARDACRAAVLKQSEEPVISPADALLADIAAVWPRNDDGTPHKNAGTADIVGRLFTIENSKWKAAWSPEAAPREMAALLAARGVHVGKVRTADGPLQGYRWHDVSRVPDVPDVPEKQ